MRNGIRVAFVMVFLAFGLICLVSCAKAKIVPVVEKEQVVSEVAPVAVENPLLKPKDHLIARGECLWTISQYYGADPFLWPILWKANRDYIVDPDWIEAGEVLEIPGRVQAEDIEWALDVSAAWPLDGKPRSMRKP